MPVIIAGNKLDLSNKANATSTENLDKTSQNIHSHRQIVTILQRYKFVRQCIKCSAKDLFNVDTIFIKAQEAVLYPITPLYDLEKGCMTDNCKRAFTRIFRMYDIDNDGLLSNTELDAFQNYAIKVPITERDFAGYKKVVSKNNVMSNAKDLDFQPVVSEGKFTVAGFLAIFDVLISQNRLDIPWRILRKFGYHDNLELHIPQSIYNLSMEEANNLLCDSLFQRKKWSLTPSAKIFLSAIFYQSLSKNSDTLSPDDILKIFSVLRNPSLPPWHPFRAPSVLKGCHSLPKFERNKISYTNSSDSSAHPTDSPPSLSPSGITICSVESLPSVEVSNDYSFKNNLRDYIKPLSYFDWIGWWTVMASISPSMTRSELYLLGHIESPQTIGLENRVNLSKSMIKKMDETVINSSADSLSVLLPSVENRIFVVGTKGCGKTAFINSLNTNDPDRVKDIDDYSKDHLSLPFNTNSPETSFVHTVLNQEKFDHSHQLLYNDRGEFISYLLFTELDEIDLFGIDEISLKIDEMKEMICGGEDSRLCDMVFLVFDCSDINSFNYVKTFEKMLLSDQVPRIYVGCKADLIDTNSFHLSSDNIPNESCLSFAQSYCSSMDLEHPLITSSVEMSDAAKIDILDHITNCTFKSLRVTPHGFKIKKQRERRKKQICFFGMSLGFFIGIGLFRRKNYYNDCKKGNGMFSWLRHLFRF
mmetsp:Transcript_2214/g.3106  ORF Transcript_2214/g.3106 Transcript_2214/m.3106 type:complete len:701 (-) Transcript_2214:92-2194(-)